VKSNDLPALYQVASAASSDSQRQFFLCVSANLLCIVVAAVLSPTEIDWSGLQLMQSIVLIVGLAATLYLFLRDPQSDWYGARALAESVKTVTWRYIMQAEPYDVSKATDNFLTSLQELLEDNNSIGHKITSFVGEPVTEEMKRVRQLNLSDRKSFYLQHRIEDQLKWYTDKSRYNKTRASRWLKTIVLFYSVALLMAMSRLKYPNFEFWWIEMLVALAGSSLAWTQIKRYQELSSSYALTAHEISILKEKLNSINSVREFSLFVGDTENAFSREHTQWRARRDSI
jgi:hypothetical protein